ncbi:hypothetical protein CMV_019339 [Castanea mollissima]|uniref:Uncharacterized protein n=1 Tax=Castanea mollissima TaxID=60419 RepID=A0A8J4R1C4_9ROSI|nr:hypothetical protein CMV_019339 [Castanea mollissima]
MEIFLLYCTPDMKLVMNETWSRPKNGAEMVSNIMEKPGGCVAKENLQCRSLKETFSRVFGSWHDDGFKFNESDNLTLMDCKAKCLNNCSCVAYASTNEENQTGCEIWSTGPRIASTDASKRRTIYFLAKNVANRRANRWWIWLIMAVGAIIISLLCFLGNAKWKKCRVEGERKKKQKLLMQEIGGNAIPSTVHDKVKKQNKDGQGSHELQIFSFESISVATNNFSTENKLGEGGFGPVYKGKLSDGPEIAIKRLSRSSGQGLVEFKNEVILIAKLQHTNLVRLLGFCIEGEEKLLIYEYMPNKSLDFFLFDSTKKHLLSWRTRFNIIEGIAQGLVYHHKYSRLRKNNSRYHFEDPLNLIGYAWQLWNEGGSISRALQQMSNATIIDEKVLNECDHHRMK